MVKLNEEVQATRTSAERMSRSHRLDGRPPEIKLIEEARDRLGISQNEAARRMSVSGTRWRQLINGERDGGQRVRGSPRTLANMAFAVGLAPEAFEEIRPDVAQLLRAMRPPAIGRELMVEQVAALLANIRRIHGEEMFNEALNQTGYGHPNGHDGYDGRDGHGAIPRRGNA